MINVFDPSEVVRSGGLLLIGIILFAEVGLFLGFILPGDTLLIAAGVYAHQGNLAVQAVIVVAAAAAIAGDVTAYYFGRKLGPKVLDRPDSAMFNKAHLAKAEAVYNKYGPKALLVTHFLPVVRTFMPLIAGIAEMPVRKFLLFAIIGDIFWALSVTLAGFYIGSKIPNIDNYILLFLLFAIAVTILPTLYHYVKVRRQQHIAAKAADSKANRE